MVDRLFSEPRLAELYDLLAPWGEPDDRFYFDLVAASNSVLDVGCGTGLLLREARKAGHRGWLVGLDPAEAMLAVARERSDVEWVLGDLSTVAWEGEFDLVVMTGHAFQVFITDEQLRAALASIRSALTDSGRFVFETRNPLARGWEDWTSDRVTEIVAANSDVVRFSREVEMPIESEIVRFAATFASSAWDHPELSHSTLRFLTADALSVFLSEAGFEIEAQFGDWDQSPLSDSSPEIVTIARPI
jgi:SAM-dependent methyltransferase